ncbi:serine/threonine protein kinase, partial [Coemansia sp. RSA 2681]
PPFKGSNEYQTFQKILKLDYAFPPTMPPLACDMVERILAIEPETRLGSTQRGGFKELKAHPFFHGFDWQDLPTRTPPPMAGPIDAVAALRTGLPPAIPPKPAVLRQSVVVVSSDDDAGIYKGRQSSSDEFGTEKTSESSFPASPDTPIDPLASFLPPNLGNYQIDAALPVSPRQTPVHIAPHRHHHLPPPPPPPPPHPPRHQQQPTLSARSSATSQQTPLRPIVPSYHQSAYSQVTSQSTDNDIYNVRLYDHVPAPLRAEEMAVVQNHHRNNARQHQQMAVMSSSSTAADYYNTASYRPPAQPMHSVYNNNYGGGGASGGGHLGSGNGISWSAKLKSL